LGSSPPAVTRLIASFEARLGVQLFNRTTRSAHLKDAGLRFVEGARTALDALDAVENEATGESRWPSGRLTVTIGRSLLPPVVNDFLRVHPRVSARVLLFDRVVNLVEEGVDVALRGGNLPDSSLISVRMGRCEADSCRESRLSCKACPAACSRRERERRARRSPCRVCPAASPSTARLSARAPRRSQGPRLRRLLSSTFASGVG
jgi:DNA-binding transcriptional LysR family regulator